MYASGSVRALTQLNRCSHEIIVVTSLEHMNNPSFQYPSPQIRAAVFHYEPSGTRWELGISTPEQRKAAWQYGHNNLILMDGTFNVSDKRLLLFIVMVIDDNYKGTCCWIRMTEYVVS
jgi:hypothetical protein